MARPLQPSAVIFDLDGTLCESYPMAIELLGDAIDEYGGGRLTAEEVVGLFGPSEQGILRAALGEVSWEGAWEHYLTGYRDRHDLCPATFPGMKPLIARLHGCGCRLGLVTGKTATTAAISLDVFGLSPYFSGIGGGAMEGIVKADRIAALLERWSIAPERAVYVGDSPTDVVEARRAGVAPVAVAWSAYADRRQLEAASPDELFDTVEGFAGWIEPLVCR
jgi:phosphoglycolate phosphatase-like HAD superfamily hydrolase